MSFFHSRKIKSTMSNHGSYIYKLRVFVLKWSDQMILLFSLNQMIPFMRKIHGLLLLSEIWLQDTMISNKFQEKSLMENFIFYAVITEWRFVSYVWKNLFSTFLEVFISRFKGILGTKLFDSMSLIFCDVVNWKGIVYSESFRKEIVY